MARCKRREVEPRHGTIRGLSSLVLLTMMLATDTTAQKVWVIDDGEKIARDGPVPALSRGNGNPIWSPGQPIRILALRDEVVAFQVFVEGPAKGVTVEVQALDAAVKVDRFVEHFFLVGRSTTGGRDYCLGWHSGSGPEKGNFVGWLPDALIPVEIAPPWSPYPMNIVAGQRGAVWVDLIVGPEQAPGLLHGHVVVRVGAALVATLPLELEIRQATLPARPVGTWLYYSRDGLRKRVGNLDRSEQQLLQLFHAHRVVGFDSIGAARDVASYLPAFDGSLYTAARGYRGPALGLGDDAIVLGTYGMFGGATRDKLPRLEAIANALAERHLFAKATPVVYADDEDCWSPSGAGWREVIASSPNDNVRRIRVAWTCSDDPARQPVDVPIVFAGAYDPARVRASGKTVWIYNGYRPATGSLLTDTEAVSMRTFGWIAAMAAIPRWFIWDSCNWYDSNRGGHGPFDPFTSAATGHNDEDGKVLMGDGLLVYPGRQADHFTEHSLEFDGVVPSIRLKNLRRGVQDAGYYQLARASARTEAEAIARRLFPRILAEARFGDPPSWPEHGQAFFEARRQLALLIKEGGAVVGPWTIMGNGPRPKKFVIRYRHLAIGLVLLAVSSAAFLRAWRKRSRHRGGA